MFTFVQSLLLLLLLVAQAGVIRVIHCLPIAISSPDSFLRTSTAADVSFPFRLTTRPSISTSSSGWPGEKDRLSWTVAVGAPSTVNATAEHMLSTAAAIAPACHLPCASCARDP